MHPHPPAIDVRRSPAWHRDDLGPHPVMADVEPLGVQSDQQFDEMLAGTGWFGVDESRPAGRDRATAARIVTGDPDTPDAEPFARGLVSEVSPIGRDVGSDDAPRPLWGSGALVFRDREPTV